jgi:hypothetical protein
MQPVSGEVRCKTEGCGHWLFSNLTSVGRTKHHCRYCKRDWWVTIHSDGRVALEEVRRVRRRVVD